jgi:hypothetical protein
MGRVRTRRIFGIENGFWLRARVVRLRNAERATQRTKRNIVKRVTSDRAA